MPKEKQNSKDMNKRHKSSGEHKRRRRTAPPKKNKNQSKNLKSSKIGQTKRKQSEKKKFLSLAEQVKFYAKELSGARNQKRSAKLGKDDVNKSQENNKLKANAQTDNAKENKQRSLGNIIDSSGILQGSSSGSASVGLSAVQSAKPSSGNAGTPSASDTSENSGSIESLESTVDEVSSEEVNKALNSITSRDTYDMILSLVDDFYKGKNIGYEGLNLLRTFQNFFRQGHGLITDYQNYLSGQQMENLRRSEYLSGMLISRLKEYVAMHDIGQDNLRAQVSGQTIGEYSRAQFVEPLNSQEFASNQSYQQNSILDSNRLGRLEGTLEKRRRKRNSQEDIDEIKAQGKRDISKDYRKD